MAAVEEFGPDGKKLGVTGESHWSLAIAENGAWHLRPGILSFNCGFLNAVEIQGRSLDCPQGPFGCSVVLYVWGNLEQDVWGSKGDIQRLRWDDGLLVEMVTLLRGVKVA